MQRHSASRRKDEECGDRLTSALTEWAWPSSWTDLRSEKCSWLWPPIHVHPGAMLYTSLRTSEALAWMSCSTMTTFPLKADLCNGVSPRQRQLHNDEQLGWRYCQPRHRYRRHGNRRAYSQRLGLLFDCPSFVSKVKEF